VNGVAGRHVLLGVSGGIACYKACTVARRLTEDGAQVDVVMTASAGEFIRPISFEALTGRPVVTSLWESGRALDHVRLGRECDLIIVAPATAHLIARMAQGLADDFLTALLLARKAPVLLCPAMNDQMFRHSATQQNLRTLAGGRRQAAVAGRKEAAGVGQTSHLTILGPVTGPLARGEGEGPGRMVEPEEICAWAERLLRSAAPFAGRHVVVTAGPTREPMDPVRVITNRSSGRMGFALARAAWARGAEVTLISGPTALAVPPGVAHERIESTEDLKDAVSRALPSADALVMAAAPSDYHPGKPAAHKTKREAGPLTLKLEPTPDVLASTVRSRKHGAVIVGFALETRDVVAAAQHKLKSKKLDLVVANSATEKGSGPESPTNRITIVSKDGMEVLPQMRKEDAAEAILDRVGVLLAARG
jgi:phosphopantothenoylcysteine decarboxylase/phosphopantothenate--cysteine ligase